MGLNSLLVNGTAYRVSRLFELLGQLGNGSNYYKVKQASMLASS